jgi:hypothetical protein
MKYIKISILALFCLSSGFAQAASTTTTPKTYYELAAMYNQIELASGEFNPWIAKLKFGYQYNENLSFEVHYGTGVKDDTDTNLNVEFKDTYGGYLRWGSGIHNNVRVYILLGQARTTINWSGSTNSGEEELDDFSWAVGAEERSKRVRNMFYTAEYASFYHKGDQDVTGISLGLRFEY